MSKNVPFPQVYAPEAKAKFEQLMADIQARYNEFTDEFGIPAEDARYVLPNASESKCNMFQCRKMSHFHKFTH